MTHPTLVHASLIAATALALAACGGGNGAGAGAAGGTLTIASATPAAHNTTLDLSRATTSGNTTRPADGFSTAAYCEVFAEGVPGANGQTYAVQVYFRQSDKAPLHASVVGGSPPTFVVFENNGGNPITGLTVDTVARTVTFANKVLRGSGGEVGTLSGAMGFQPNATTAACGS
jgi:hypothetical protein